MSEIPTDRWASIDSYSGQKPQIEKPPVVVADKIDPNIDLTIEELGLLDHYFSGHFNTREKENWMRLQSFIYGISAIGPALKAAKLNNTKPIPWERRNEVARLILHFSSNKPKNNDSKRSETDTDFEPLPTNLNSDRRPWEPERW